MIIFVKHLAKCLAQRKDSVKGAANIFNKTPHSYAEVLLNSPAIEMQAMVKLANEMHFLASRGNFLYSWYLHARNELGKENGEDASNVFEELKNSHRR